MANIKLKITALSPLHIGSGEVYEPTNFVIDDNILYEFRDEAFYEELAVIEKEKFMNIITDNTSDSFVRIHRFVKEHKAIAKKIAHIKVSVSSGLQNEYNKRVGSISQIEGKNRQVFNKFEIQRIQRKQIKTKDGYANIGYIAGSSLKGAISTAYQEYIYKKEGQKVLKERFQSVGREINKNIFKEFKVADSITTKIGTKIGFSLNKERFEYDSNNPQNNLKLHTQIEVLNQTSEFVVDINYGELNIREILSSCNSHYMPIFKSLLSNETNGVDEYSNEYLSDKFYDAYRHFQLKENQYLIRVGKHSGARAVTIDGMRKIKSLISSKPYKTEIREDETTTWLFGDNPNSNSGLLPFGWVLCEIVGT